jgi:ArsR family transcriptional regulator, cadmium/lead-responsive transcriptional repressor
MAMTEVAGDVAARESEAMVVAACLFHGFSDPSRLAILQHLALGEHRVVDLTKHLGLAQSTVSKHLACLRDCRLIDYRVEGRQSFYSLTRPELLDLLRDAQALLVQTGEAVAICPVYGEPGRGATVQAAAANTTTASGATSVAAP